MRIVLDLQACQGESSFRGIGRYSFFLAQAMTKEALERGHEVFILLNSYYPESIQTIKKSFAPLLNEDKFIEFCVDKPVAFQIESNRQNLIEAISNREEAINVLNPDIVHISDPFGGFLDNVVISVPTFNNKTFTVSTFYDLIPYVIQNPYLLDLDYKFFYLERFIKIQNAQMLLAISEYSKQEALSHMESLTGDIVNISAAVDGMFKKITISQEKKDQLLSKYQISKDFVFYVPGGFDPRKNFENLLQAYSLLPHEIRTSHQLVIGSKISDDMREHLNALALTFGMRDEELVLTSYMSDDELISMYNICKLYVFPSLHEGFGLPVLEAMSCGAPVIGSNTTSLPEVIGCDEALFDPHSVKDISEKMAHGLTDPKFHQFLCEHALKHAKDFTWEKSAVTAIDAFELLYQNHEGLK